MAIDPGVLQETLYLLILILPLSPCSLTNRVIAGMLLYQTRTNDTNCSDSKFNQIQQTCTGPTTLKAFGVDPVFKSGTMLYNPDYDDIANSIVTQFYDCKQVRRTDEVG